MDLKHEREVLCGTCVSFSSSPGKGAPVTLVEAWRAPHGEPVSGAVEKGLEVPRDCLLSEVRSDMPLGQGGRGKGGFAT